jgi:tetratricopeptide (TPR) repeat protein
MLSERQPEKFDNRRPRSQNIRNEDKISPNEPETVQLSHLNTIKHIQKISTEPEQPKPWWGGPPGPQPAPRLASLLESKKSPNEPTASPVRPSGLTTPPPSGYPGQYRQPNSWRYSYERVGTMSCGGRAPLRLIATVLLLAFCLSSCSRDPNAVKRRFLEGGNKYFQKGQYAQARIMYLSAVKTDAKYGEAYYRLALAEIKLASIEKTLIALRRAVELLPEGPDRDDARVKLADIYLGFLEHNRFQKQVAGDTDVLAADLLQRNPDSYEGHRIRGTVALIRMKDLVRRLPGEAAKEVALAIAELQTANQVRPLQPEVIVPLAGSLAAVGKNREAEDLLRQSIDQNKANLDVYRELRAYYLRNKRFDDAQRILELAVRSNPKEYSLLVDMAAYYWATGKPEEAVRIIDGMTARLKDFPNAFEVAGNFYLGLGRADEAIQQYEKGAAAFPADKLKYKSRIAGVQMLRHQWDEARQINDAILKERPKDVDALVRRAELQFQAGDVKGSIAQLEEALRLNPNNPLARYDLGHALLANKQPERARYEFSEAIRWAPANIAARLELAQIQIDSGEFGKAVAAAEEALAYRPADHTAHMIRAIGLRGMKKYDQARAELNSMLAAKPDSPDVLYQLAALDALLGKWKEAEAGYRKSYEINPANARGLMAMAASMVARNQTGQALAVLQAEVNKTPQRNDLHFALATFANRVGRLDIAISELEGLLGRIPPSSRGTAETQTLLSECYIKDNQFQKALPHIEAAHKLEPDNPAVLHYLGLVYDKLGRGADARRIYEASLKQNANDGIVLNNLAYLIVEGGGDPDLALTYAQRARKEMPHEAGFADTVGVIYLKKNLVDNALEIFEDLVRKNPGYPVFRLHLGEALLRKGETAKARKELQVALASKPSTEETARIKELLAKAGT